VALGIDGISGYAVRPPQVRREKPRVSTFTSADIPKIPALEPVLALTFSDLKANIAAELIRAGVRSTVSLYRRRCRVSPQNGAAETEGSAAGKGVPPQASDRWG
jgi:hypothetical protein